MARAVTALAVLLLHAALCGAVAPLMAAAPSWLGARAVGLAPAPLSLAWHDLARLRRKQTLRPPGASPITWPLPGLAFAATLTACALLPGPFMPPGGADALVVAGLLALSRSAVALAAMEQGGASGGLFGSRALWLGACGDVVLVSVLLGLGLLGGGTEIGGLVRQVREGGMTPAPLLALALALAALALADLTVMEGDTIGPPAGDAAGPDLALLRWHAGLRVVLWAELVGLVCPIGLGPAGTLGEAPAGALGWLLRLGGFAALLALWRAVRPRSAPAAVGTLLVCAGLVGLVGCVLALTGQGVA